MDGPMDRGRGGPHMEGGRGRNMDRGGGGHMDRGGPPMEGVRGGSMERGRGGQMDNNPHDDYHPDVQTCVVSGFLPSGGQSDIVWYSSRWLNRDGIRPQPRDAECMGFRSNRVSLLC